MAVAPEVVHDYYRRAAMLATLIRRQATDSGTVTLPSSTISTDTATTSSSSASISSVSTQSTQSSVSQSSQSSRSTASAQSTTNASPTSASVITSDVSSTFSSQYVTTNSSGQIVTTTLVIVPTGSTTDTTASSPPIGAIVGGVVGGIAAIALVGLVIFLIRRKMKRDDFEANIFDPDRNVERPTSTGVGRQFDLGGQGGGATALGAGAGGIAAVDAASHVTPYSYGPSSNGPTSTNHGSSVLGQPEMQQAPNAGYYPDPYGQNQYSQYPTTAQYPQNSVGVGEHFPNPYAPGYHPAATMAGGALGAGMVAHGASRGQTMSSVSSGYPPTSPVFSGQSQDGMSQSTSPPPTVPGAYAAQNPRSAKEREAFARTNNQYSVANQGDPRNPSPTPSANRSSVVGSSAVGPTSPVVVHQDGGRVQDEDEGGNEEAEIPPTYDSIPRGH